MMDGRVPFGSGAQNRVFIDLTDETEPVDSTMVSAYPKATLLKPISPGPVPHYNYLSLFRRFFSVSPKPTVDITIDLTI